MTNYDKIRRNAAKIGRDAYVHAVQPIEYMSWKNMQHATDAAISFYNAALDDISEQLQARPLGGSAFDFACWLTTRPTVIKVGGSETVYAMFDALKEFQTLETERAAEKEAMLGPKVAERRETYVPETERLEAPEFDDTVFMVGKYAFETLCERLAKAEDRLVKHFTVLEAHEGFLKMIGYPNRAGTPGVADPWADEGGREDMRSTAEPAAVGDPEWQVGDSVTLKPGALSVGGSRFDTLPGVSTFALVGRGGFEDAWVISDGRFNWAVSAKHFVRVGAGDVDPSHHAQQ